MLTMVTSRTVIETKDPYESNMGRSWTGIYVAYINLPLWEKYTARVQADIARLRKAKQEGVKELQNKM